MYCHSLQYCVLILCFNFILVHSCSGRALQEVFRTQVGMRNLTKSLLELLQRRDVDEAGVAAKLVVLSSM